MERVHKTPPWDHVTLTLYSPCVLTSTERVNGVIYFKTAHVYVHVDVYGIAVAVGLNVANCFHFTSFVLSSKLYNRAAQLLEKRSSCRFAPT